MIFFIENERNKIYLPCLMWMEPKKQISIEMNTFIFKNDI